MGLRVLPDISTNRSVGDRVQVQVQFDPRVYGPQPHGRVREKGDVGGAEPVAHGFKAEQEVRCVLPQRPGDRGSELVALERRLRRAVEIIARVELAVAEIFKERAVKIVAAGAADGVQNPARAAPVLGAVVGAEHLHLQDRIRSQLHPCGAARHLVFCVHHVRSVEQERV